MASSDVKYPWPSTVNVASFISVKPSLQDEERTNFHIWKAQMVCLLESQDLFGFINGEILEPLPTGNITTIPEDQSSKILENVKCEQRLWRRTDKLVKGWILGSIGTDALGHTWELDTAREVWLELEMIFNEEKSETATEENCNSEHGIQSSSSKEDGGAASEESDESEHGIVENSPSEEDGGDPTTNIEEMNPKKYFQLHGAVLQGNWGIAKQIFDNDRSTVKGSINFLGETALHIAVGTGKAIHFVERLVNEMPDEWIATMDGHGKTALHVAAAVGNKKAACILVKKMPELPNILDNYGHYPLQIAALYAQREMLEYLIYISKCDAGQNLCADLAGRNLLLFVIEAGFFDIALDLVETCPDLARLKPGPNYRSPLIKIIEKKSIFGAKNFNLWERCISLVFCMETIFSPQFGNGYDLESMAHNDQTGLIKKIKDKKLKQQALQLVKKFCEKNELFSFTEVKDIYYDAILLATKLGVHEVVEEIVEAYPSAIYITEYGSNYSIFHVAVKNRSERVYNLIYQMSDYKHLYSGIQDSKGNNILHLAAKLAPPHKLNEIFGAALQMQREIQWYKEVEKFVHNHSKEQLNLELKSPKMIFTEEHKILKNEGEKWMKDTSNSCTIAAALIGTVMFAAAITVPGGNDNSSGLPIFSRNSAFIAFVIADAISLFTSATSLLMFLAILTSHYAEEDFLYVLPKRLIIGLGTLFISITFMMVAFSATLYLVIGQKQALVVIPLAALASLPITSFVRLQFPLMVQLVYSTYGRGIFGKQSNRPFY